MSGSRPGLGEACWSGWSGGIHGRGWANRPGSGSAARTECGGYDTCVTEHTAKLRAQKKATTTKSTTRTGQHNQSQKKTQTPDYRGKGG
ncbi:hypothetical protein ACFWNT_44290, partial [Streptomyces sp. NPDC058409]|uniref:hypothetical protein n=1 Tax=Streptomyces sp. NPDC058409 TaxID=3346484 RepID=UPI003650926A